MRISKINHEYKVCCAGVVIGTLTLDVSLPDYLLQDILTNAVVDGMEIIDDELPKAKGYETEGYF